ncbi:MAG: hypothetical protein GDA36_13135 [Rhodobacteraceae bacterium]|nr:hypothetical protein [Paracoccaceae bacterium]
MIFWPGFAVFRKTEPKWRTPTIYPTIQACISVPIRKRDGQERRKAYAGQQDHRQTACDD